MTMTGPSSAERSTIRPLAVAEPVSQPIATLLPLEPAKAQLPALLKPAIKDDFQALLTRPNQLAHVEERLHYHYKPEVSAEMWPVPGVLATIAGVIAAVAFDPMIGLGIFSSGAALSSGMRAYLPFARKKAAAIPVTLDNKLETVVSAIDDKRKALMAPSASDYTLGKRAAAALAELEKREINDTATREQLTKLAALKDAVPQSEIDRAQAWETLAAYTGHGKPDDFINTFNNLSDVEREALAPALLERLFPERNDVSTKREVRELLTSVLPPEFPEVTVGVRADVLDKPATITILKGLKQFVDAFGFESSQGAPSLDALKAYMLAPERTDVERAVYGAFAQRVTEQRLTPKQRALSRFLAELGRAQPEVARAEANELLTHIDSVTNDSYTFERSSGYHNRRDEVHQRTLREVIGMMSLGLVEMR